MAPKLPDRKRKALSKESESEDELLGALDLEGVLSDSEGDISDGQDGGEDSADEEEQYNEDSSEADGEDDDGDEALLSDDIPSDVDEEEAIQKLLVAKYDAETERLTPEITEPGVDPKPKKSDDDEGLNYRVEKDANGGERYVYDEIDPVYDSDDTDVQGPENTVGNIPLSYYDSYPHIGYDINGKKIMRPANKESLDALLDSIEIPEGFTGLTDADSGGALNLSREELELISRVQRGLIPDESYDPYPDMVEYFTSTVEPMPLSGAPEPKSRFVPSKHEAKRIMKLVRAIREGRILPYKPLEEREKEDQEQEETYYDLWHDEEAKEPHVMHIPAPKLPPPGFDLSYNPPLEYLPTLAEKKQWEETDPEDREKEYLPKRFDSLRKVPGYDTFVKERFERCLDLYLAPRVRKNRLRIDPNSLLPKLPRPEDLRPFPSTCKTVFHGHEGRVRSLAISPCGEYLASGGDDGTARVWALHTGRQCFSVKLSSDEAVNTVRWRPTKDAFILSAAAGEDVFLMVPPVGAEVDGQQLEQTSREILDAGFGYAAKANQKPTEPGKEPPAKWARPGAKLEDEGVLIRITVRSAVKVINWHRRGDHFTTVSPQGQRRSVIIHTLSQHRSQVPFRKHSGLVQFAAFHPSRPMLFVATQRSIRIYDLQKLELIKTLQPGSKWISSFSIHPQGDNLIVGGYDRKLMWHDLDLDNKPYKSMRFHSSAVRAVRFHSGGLPLFADTSDDGTLQVFHGKPGDYMENPTIVPLKVLRGHSVVQNLGVMDVDWHPREAWLVSAGSDGTCRLWV